MDKRHGTDAEGFIRRIPSKHLQPEFKSTVEDMCSSLVGILGEVVDSIYLYGSVAGGTAKLGESDLDVTLLINGQPEFYADQINLIKNELQTRHPEITKIDFDIGSITEALAPENLLSWGYWLKHHCKCVWGRDVTTSLQRFKPSRAIALAVNGDFASILGKYAEKIEHTTDAIELRRLQREASRKLIRSTNILRMEQDESWPLTLEDHVELFLQIAPKMKPEIDYFLKHARTPSSEADTFSAALNFFTDWLQEQQALRGIPT
jgi:predicted nucleotidyltransferase